MKMNALSGLLVSVINASQTSLGLAAEQASDQPSSFECPDIDRDSVLIDSMLFQCSDKQNLTKSEILECKRLVKCLMEAGYVLDGSVLTEVNNENVPGASTGGACTQVPTKCVDE